MNQCQYKSYEFGGRGDLKSTLFPPLFFWKNYILSKIWGTSQKKFGICWHLPIHDQAYVCFKFRVLNQECQHHKSYLIKLNFSIIKLSFWGFSFAPRRRTATTQAAFLTAATSATVLRAVRPATGPWSADTSVRPTVTTGFWSNSSRKPRYNSCNYLFFYSKCTYLFEMR